MNFMSLGACIWDFGLRSQSWNGKIYKNLFTDPNYHDAKEEFLYATDYQVIGYHSIDPWNNLETYG